MPELTEKEQAQKEILKKIMDNRDKLFQSSPDGGIISEFSGNLIIGTILAVFIIGLIVFPADATSFGDGISKLMKNFTGGEKPKDPKDKFKIPSKGGALQNMPKDKDGCISLKLKEKITVSDDTFIFRFDLLSKDVVFGLPIGKHVVWGAEMPTKDEPKGELVERKYTPISTVDAKGHIDFLIKIYRANVHPRFPEGGLMTQYVEKMKIGDSMLMEGPKGRLEYQGFGNFVIQKKPVSGKKNIGCVAGGTGITPCFQVIQASLMNRDGCKTSLVFGNRTTSDILLKQELNDLATDFKDNFNLFLTVDVQPDEKENWKQGVGFITKEMLEKNMPKPGPDTIILYCGPPPFEKMMAQHLKDLGYSSDMQFKF